MKQHYCCSWTEDAKRSCECADSQTETNLVFPRGTKLNTKPESKQPTLSVISSNVFHLHPASISGMCRLDRV